MKIFLMALTAFFALSFQSVALADFATTPQPYPQTHPQPYPQPYYPNQPTYPAYGSYPYPTPTYPGPVYAQPPAPWVMCFAQGLANGALFYGVGLNVYAANQWAIYACQSTGQYCQLTGCRY